MVYLGFMVLIVPISDNWDAIKAFIKPSNYLNRQMVMESRQAKWQRLRKEAGECVQCGVDNKARGTLLCEKCQKKQSAINKRVLASKVIDKKDECE